MADWQNWTRRQELGHYDLIQLLFFFILISLKSKALLILHTKFQLNIPSHFGEKVGFIGFAILRIDGDLTSFYHSEAMLSGIAACEI